MIKVLIVEDSSVVREFLANIFSSDPEIEVVGMARDGEEAIEAVERRRPDVVTMDIYMPKMNGLDATRRIMETRPIPIVIVSGCQNLKEVETTFRAVEAGALAVLPRPEGIGHPEHEAGVKDLVRTVKLMSEVKVVKRWPRAKTLKAGIVTPVKERAVENPPEIEIVAMGASTGGPVTLKTILSGLSKDFPVPLLIAQHITPGFVRGFCEWLSRSSQFPVEIAEEEQILSPGRAYVAPDGFDMGVKPGNKIGLRKGGSNNGPHPSVSYLFESVSRVYGANAAAVLLTGMGLDGAKEMKAMKEKGAVTMAQDEESSVVYGMPGEAVKLNAATYVFSPDAISRTLMGLAGRRSGASLKVTGG